MALFYEPVLIMPGMTLLPGFAAELPAKPLLEEILSVSPLRHMQTQRGFTMSVGMTNCGEVGWVSDRRGYRYSPVDPETGNPWPAIPVALSVLANRAAEACGFANFNPDVCLVNCYTPGAQMGAHQDRNEQDFDQPIVSLSLGIPARFFVLGEQKSGKSLPVDLCDGDMLVFGGPARRYFHGVRKLKEAAHPVFGNKRWNLTFRVAQ